MKTEQMIGTRLPKNLVRDLEQIEAIEQADRSATVRKLLARAVRDWKLEHYAREYGHGRMTLARAAAEADVTLWEMTSYVQSEKIPAQYDTADLGHDLQQIKAGQRQRPRRSARLATARERKDEEGAR